MKVTKSILKQMILEGIDEVFAPGDPRYKATADISGLTHNKGKRDPSNRNVMSYTVSSNADVTPGQVKDYAHKELAKGHPADVRISKIDERSYRVTIRFIKLDEEIDENLLDIGKNARDFFIPKKNKPLTADQALQKVQDILAAKELPTAKKLKAAHDFLMLNLYPKDAPSLVEKGEE